MTRIRTLLVDDSPMFLDAACAFLETVPEVDIIGRARNGLEAVEMAKALKPDLVLTDVSMPVIDGYTTSRLLKLLDPPPTVIIVSMLDTESFRRMAQSARSDGFISKQEFANGVSRAISRMLDPL